MELLKAVIWIILNALLEKNRCILFTIENPLNLPINVLSQPLKNLDFYHL